MTTSPSLTSELSRHIAQSIGEAKGWIGFDAYINLALYTPGLGYYAHGSAKFGVLPYTVKDAAKVAGSDFVTAPEITPLFGWTLARQVMQALHAALSMDAAPTPTGAAARGTVLAALAKMR